MEMENRSPKPVGCCRRIVKAHANAHKAETAGPIRRNVNPFVIGNLWWIIVQALCTFLTRAGEGGGGL